MGFRHAFRAGASEIVLALVLLSSGCGWQMARQPRYDHFEPRRSEPDLSSARRPPAGVVPYRDARVRSAQSRPAITPELLKRGEERYGIYCAVCHGSEGGGDGVVPEHGFPEPPSFLSQRLRQADDLHFWSAITNGAGRMYPYANRVSPEDRWAITAWIRVLQKADQLQKEEADHAQP